MNGRSSEKMHLLPSRSSGKREFRLFKKKQIIQISAPADDRGSETLRLPDSAEILASANAGGACAADRGRDRPTGTEAARLAARLS
ncbi:Hypothetical protein NTJ_05946 [Nesidiocoris tenuis]|uniref:Uncharacterized protein n=1 Tax=Nesidiocoris tenuis TaxID=355587 RepID=A0ABN7APB8_9HEMI|nr:Hypothetical protein NTJ_05946 [Nesidiocoris tenuis]